MIQRPDHGPVPLPGATRGPSSQRFIRWHHLDVPMGSTDTTGSRVGRRVPVLIAIVAVIIAQVSFVFLVEFPFYVSLSESVLTRLTLYELLDLGYGLDVLKSIYFFGSLIPITAIFLLGVVSPWFSVLGSTLLSMAGHYLFNYDLFYGDIYLVSFEADHTVLIMSLAMIWLTTIFSLLMFHRFDRQFPKGDGIRWRDRRSMLWTGHRVSGTVTKQREIQVLREPVQTVEYTKARSPMEGDIVEETNLRQHGQAPIEAKQPLERQANVRF